MRKHFCNFTGCTATIPITEKRCDKHVGKRLIPDTRTNRLYDRRWRKERLRYLRANPLCAECIKVNTLTPAVIVDHITPHKDDIAVFWDIGNWQALCKRCHDKKTATRDGGFGR